MSSYRDLLVLVVAVGKRERITVTVLECTTLAFTITD